MPIVVWMKYFNLHCVSTNHVLCEVILSELLREPLGTKNIQTLLSNKSLWAVKREGCRVCSYHPRAHCCVGQSINKYFACHHSYLFANNPYQFPHLILFINISLPHTQKGSMHGSLPRAYVPTSNKSILEANKCPGLDLYALHYGTTGEVQAEG